MATVLKSSAFAHFLSFFRRKRAYNEAAEERASPWRRHLAFGPCFCVGEAI